MGIAASVSCSQMTCLMDKIPTYSDYRSLDEAADAERIFRHALGIMLKDCGEHLLNVAENRGQLLSMDQQLMIDVLIDRIGSIFRRLDREGVVCLVGDCQATIAELEELDTRLILLIEEALNTVRHLETEVPAASWFNNEACRLSQDLATFSEMTEERNYLLGLGWESEFTWPGRSTS